MSADMQKAYRLAALAVRQRLAEQHPRDLEILSSIRAGEVAVYAGSFDQAEEVFRCLELPATLNPKAEELSARAVFVNCSSTVDAALVSCISGHVERGAWLVTSDWALDRVIEPAFPGLMRWNKQMTPTEIISVEPAMKSLWSEIVVLGADPQWWLWGSHPIEVLDPDRVKVEAASHDLLARYRAPVVAARFAWGRGQVFHAIGHFWAKSSATPTLRHTGPCSDFLRAGMRLSEAGIERVLKAADVAPEAVNFGTLQSAATATELVAQLCVQSKRSEVG